MIKLFKQYFWNVIRYHYFDFKGRATRKEYWMFFLFSKVIFSLLLSFFIFICIIVPCLYYGDINGHIIVALFKFIFFSISYIVYVVPDIALVTRRLHDINYSGWWQILPLCLGVFYSIFLMRGMTFISLILGLVLVIGSVFIGLSVGFRKSVEPNKYTVYSAEVLKNPKLPR